MTILQWVKGRDQNRFFTTCPFQYRDRKLRLKCDRVMQPCPTVDLYRCRFIPQAELILIEVAYFFRRKLWRRIGRVVESRRKEEAAS